MKIACIQLNPQDDYGSNLERAAFFVAKAAKEGAEVVMLPEVFSYMGSNEGRLETACRLGEGVFAQMEQWARLHSVWLIGGSVAEKTDYAERVFNTCCVFNPQGEVENLYRKIHLFNLRDSAGRSLFCEEEVFLAGTTLPTFLLSDRSGAEWNAMTAICYDVRFPELLRTRSSIQRPFDLCFFPAAFVYETGRDHWEILLRARAIENQCFVIACNQTGTFLDGQKRNWGHSMVIDPWGRVIASLSEEVGILYVDLDKESLRLARTRLPALADRIPRLAAEFP